MSRSKLRPVPDAVCWSSVVLPCVLPHDLDWLVFFLENPASLICFKPRSPKTFSVKTNLCRRPAACKQLLLQQYTLLWKTTSVVERQPHCWLPLLITMDLLFPTIKKTATFSGCISICAATPFAAMFCSSFANYRLSQFSQTVCLCAATFSGCCSPQKHSWLPL